MITRDKVTPRDGLVAIKTVDNEVYTARHLEGNKSYDGWYIPKDRRIVSQKELQVAYYYDGHEWKEYITKDILDDVFGSRQRLDPIIFQSRLYCAKRGILIPREELI